MARYGSYAFDVHASKVIDIFPTKYISKINVTRLGTTYLEMVLYC
jgi:hypothetical protein